jgi:hypothetical protein
MVGIVVLNYKKATLTLDCVRSLQTMAMDETPVEILIVDNASKDGSVQTLREALPDIPLFESEANLGYAGGNNIGVKLFLERGAAFVWILNNDTKVAPDTLQRMILELRNHARLGMVGSNIRSAERPECTLQMGGGRISLWTGLNRPVVTSGALGRINYLTGSSLLIRREALEEVGLLDDHYFHYWEDVDLCFRMRAAGWDLGCVPAANVYHHEGSSLSTGSPKATFYFSRGIVRFFLKNSTTGLLPVLVSTTLRMFKAILLLRFRTAGAVWNGFWSGLKGYPKAYPPC